jgi:RND family efflux transporter MFP subunit
MSVFKTIPFLFVAAIFTACGSKEVKKEKPAPVKVSVRVIEATQQEQVLGYSGMIEPDNTAQVGFAVQGVVNHVAVQEGQHVKQGQLLASIDDTEYRNALAIADAGFEQAEDMYNRLHGLYEKGSLPEKDYIDIKTKLAQAKANKSINAKRIADSRLYAPMSGIITKKQVERGSAAAPGVSAFTIIKTDVLYARISVPESEVGALRSGTEAQVFIPTLNDTIKGRISIINPQADEISRAYTVKAKLDNSGSILLPGMLVEVRIHTGGKSNAITIPATAVIRDADNITYVFVANGQNTAVRKRITTGALTGDNDVVVTAGLQKGDRLIVAGQTHLKDGSALSF